MTLVEYIVAVRSGDDKPIVALRLIRNDLTRVEVLYRKGFNPARSKSSALYEAKTEKSPPSGALNSLPSSLSGGGLARKKSGYSIVVP